VRSAGKASRGRRVSAPLSKLPEELRFFAVVDRQSDSLEQAAQIAREERWFDAQSLASPLEKRDEPFQRVVCIHG